MTVEAWVTVGLMALFNVLSTAFYIGVNKQMLTEVMRRVGIVEDDKADRDLVNAHIEHQNREVARLDREVSSVRHDVKNIMQRREAMRGGE